MHGQEATFQDPYTGEIIAVFGEINKQIRVEPAKRIPVYCLFAVYEDDCVEGSDGRLIINFSDEKKKTIREHFPDYDGVVIIDNPEQFIDEVIKTIGYDVKNDEVQYFNIDDGGKTKDGQVAWDLRYLKYLIQDTNFVSEDGKKIWFFSEKDVYKLLFCKDKYFQKEQEYRFILWSEQIDSGKKYAVKLSKEYVVSDINEVLGS